MRRPTRSGPASNATATGSSTTRPSGDWPARRRSSSSPRTISAPDSPMPSRSPRWPRPSLGPSASTSPWSRPSPWDTTAATARGVMPPRTPSRPYVDGGYDHAVWGADVVLAPLNLCAETTRRDPQPLVVPAGPGHPGGRGRVVGRPDRLRLSRLRGCGTGRASSRPTDFRPWCETRCGDRRSRQLDAFIRAAIDADPIEPASSEWSEPVAEALAEFRRFNYDHIYMRPESIAQSRLVIEVLRAWSSTSPPRRGCSASGRRPIRVEPDSPAAFRDAVGYVAGMTDRYAFDTARDLLGWRPEHLPVGIP